MRFISGKVGCYGSLEYAKNIINKIGNIVKVEIYNNEKTPYYEDFGIEKYYYNFIAFDDEENEIWFDTNCGYRGSKPSTTEQILQFLGIRNELGIYTKKEIKEDNLNIVNDLNILVLSNNLYSNKSKELFMIKIRPNKANDRYNVIRGLENIGDFKSYEKKMTEYEMRFKNLYKDNSFGEYKVNKIFFVSRQLKDMRVEDLRRVFETIISRNMGLAMEIDIQKL